MLISLNEAKKHLRVEHEADDEYITGLIIAAQQWAENFLNMKFREVVEEPEPTEDNDPEANNDDVIEDDASGDGVSEDEEELIECQAIHKQAMLLVIGAWYEHREDGANNYVPNASKNLLYALRRIPV